MTFLQKQFTIVICIIAFAFSYMGNRFYLRERYKRDHEWTYKIGEKVKLQDAEVTVLYHKVGNEMYGEQFEEYVVLFPNSNTTLVATLEQIHK